MSVKATVLDLVTLMACGQNDTLMSSRYFDEVILDLAKAQWFVTMTGIAGVVGQAVYAYPAGAVTLIGVFYGAHQLERATLRELEYVDPQWRDATGEPVCFVDEGETTHTVRLYPIPDVATQPVAYLFGEPLGRGYPDGEIVMLHSETRTTVPDYLDLPIALMVIEREFSRESDHQHPVLAKQCGELGRLMLEMTKPSAG